MAHLLIWRGRGLRDAVFHQDGLCCCLSVIERADETVVSLIDTLRVKRQDTTLEIITMRGFDKSLVHCETLSQSD